MISFITYKFPKVDLTLCINFEIGPEFLCALKSYVRSGLCAWRAVHTRSCVV